MEVKRLCGRIVQHFYYTEHKFITRMVLYFKSDKRDRLWLLWCGSLRVSDRTSDSEMPVNLISNFTEPQDKNTFDEDEILLEADKAFLRVTNDEMFYETYLKNVPLMAGTVNENTGEVPTREVHTNADDKSNVWRSKKQADYDGKYSGKITSDNSHNKPSQFALNA